MNKKNILIVFGTRPEAIKLAPLAKYLQKQTACCTKLCVTGQHRQMLDSVLELFELQPDFDLNVMQQGQQLADVTARILLSLNAVFDQFQPDVVIVHGDTTTTFATSLACYYRQIPLAHVEAGLRTGNLLSPFPEEGNRQLTAVLAHYHFAPTEQAKQNLLNEGKSPEQIFVTGNTVVDALFSVLQNLAQNPPLAQKMAEHYAFLDPQKKCLLVTCHRRESFGDGLEQICEALLAIAEQHPDVQIVFPVHLNPKVREPVQRLLANHSAIFLLEPQAYLPFVYLMNHAHLILTDSGGIQEEAAALNKPVLVMRTQTERVEALASGGAKLVGANKTLIVESVSEWLQKPVPKSQQNNPYGDGNASQRIAETLLHLLYAKD